MKALRIKDPKFTAMKWGVDEDGYIVMEATVHGSATEWFRVRPPSRRSRRQRKMKVR